MSNSFDSILNTYTFPDDIIDDIGMERLLYLAGFMRGFNYANSFTNLNEMVTAYCLTAYDNEKSINVMFSVFTYALRNRNFGHFFTYDNNNKAHDNLVYFGEDNSLQTNKYYQIISLSSKPNCDFKSYKRTGQYLIDNNCFIPDRMNNIEDEETIINNAKAFIAAEAA